MRPEEVRQPVRKMQSERWTTVELITLNEAVSSHIVVPCFSATKIIPGLMEHIYTIISRRAAPSLIGISSKLPVEGL